MSKSADKEGKLASSISLDVGPMMISRKSFKKGIHFNMLVVGESGQGKSTFINSLLSTKVEIYDPIETEKGAPFQMKVFKILVENNNSKINLSVVIAPGYGNKINNTGMNFPIVEYIDKQFDKYYCDEVGLNRNTRIDNRVHCCVYFIKPLSRGLNSIDIEFMRSVQDKVNIIPVLAKADAYTSSELIMMKNKVLNDLKSNDIRPYNFPVCDEYDEPNFAKMNEQLKKRFPFALISGESTFEINGKVIRGRKYPWGVVDIEDTNICDFVHLRSMLLQTHIHDLCETTEEVFYENFRHKIIKKAMPST